MALENYLLEAIERLQKILTESSNIKDETKKNIYIVEQSQEVHQILHHIGKIASVPPITNALKHKESGEISRLKDIVKEYRQTIDKLGKKRHPRDF